MNNLLSYFGLVDDARISASEKDLPVLQIKTPTQTTTLTTKRLQRIRSSERPNILKKISMTRNYPLSENSGPNLKPASQEETNNKMTPQKNLVKSQRHRHQIRQLL